VAIKVCFKASKSVIQTVEMVHTAYGNEAVMRYNVFGWYGWIREVREDVQGNPSSRRPSDGKIEKCSAAFAAKLYPVTLNDSR